MDRRIDGQTDRLDRQTDRWPKCVQIISQCNTKQTWQDDVCEANSMYNDDVLHEPSIGLRHLLNTVLHRLQLQQYTCTQVKDNTVR